MTFLTVKNRRILAILMMIALLAMPFVAIDKSYATSSLHLIGSSPCEKVADPSIWQLQTYGADPSLPIILAFDNAATGLSASDFTLKDASNQNVAFTLSTSGMQYNEIALIPDTVLVSNSTYTLTFGSQVINIKTKLPGGGAGSGGGTPLYCVGKIVDDHLNGGIAGTYLVPRNQQFLFTFTNNVMSNTNNVNAVKLYKWTGTGAPVADFTNANWTEVTGKTVTLGYNSVRWYIAVQANGLLDANTFYGISIDNTLKANNGSSLTEPVAEIFKVGTVTQ